MQQKDGDLQLNDIRAIFEANKDCIIFLVRYEYYLVSDIQNSIELPFSSTVVWFVSFTKLLKRAYLN